MNKTDLQNIIKEEIRSVLTEMSIRQIKGRIFDLLSLPEVQEYKLDEFNYENIPIEIFQQNGISPIHLKQYDNSTDIVTFDLGININPIKKDVDVFLQRQGIFNEGKHMENKEALLKEYIRKYIRECMDGMDKEKELNEANITYDDYLSYVNTGNLSDEQQFKLLFEWVKTDMIKLKEFIKIMHAYIQRT